MTTPYQNIKQLIQTFSSNNYIETNPTLIIYFIFFITHLLISTLYIGQQFSYTDSFQISILASLIQIGLATTIIHYLAPNYLVKSIFSFIMLYLLLTTTYPFTICSIFSFFFQEKPEVVSFLTQKRTWWFHFADCSITIVGLFALVYGYKWAQISKVNQQLQLQHELTELKYLNTQINPHFLFNTLNNIYALSIKKSEQTPELILMLADIMRYIIYECADKQEVDLQQEIKHLQNYVNLERIRQEKNANITFKVIGAINQQKIVPLLLLPFIENSFKHGLHQKIQHAFVHIVITVNSNLLFLQVSNSKLTTLPNAPSSLNEGIGLANTQKRLNLLYPNKHQLEIKVENELYEVNLKLQLL